MFWQVLRLYCLVKTEKWHVKALRHDVAVDPRISYDSCPLCDSKSFCSIGHGDCSKHALYQPELGATIAWNKCNECHHIFTEGYFTEQACEILFSKTHDRQSVGYDAEQSRIASAKMIDKILPYTDGGRWLDVGFGNASLLFTVQEFGFDAVGVDLRPENVKILNALGIEAYCTEIQNLRLDGQFSVISLMDVLEHVPFPRDFLASVKRLLKKDGVLLISLPNSETILWDLVTRNNDNPYWGEIEHYHNFGRSRLYDLLREFDIEPVRYGISERYRLGMEVIAIRR